MIVSKTFTILGLIISLVGLLSLIWLLSSGVINAILYSTFRVKSDYWMWDYILIPFFFIITGGYYLYLGIKQAKTNKLISVSLGFQLVALVIGIFGLLLPILSHAEFGYLITLLFGTIAVILMTIGIVIFMIGWAILFPSKIRYLVIPLILILAIIYMAIR